MGWQDTVSSTKLFRRKPAHELPLYMDTPHTHSNKPNIRKHYHYKHYMAVIILMFVILCMYYGVSVLSYEEDEGPVDSIVSIFASKDTDESDHIEVESMDEIMKRHPYKYVDPAASSRDNYAVSRLLSNGPPKQQRGDSVDSSHESLEARSEPVQRDDGNIVFFSFHGKVGCTTMMHVLEEQYGIVNGGELHLQQKLRHNNSITDKWDSYDPSQYSDVNKKAIIEYISAVFDEHGPPPFKQRKSLSVHMTDAWANGVDIAWLVEVLQRVGGVTHMVITVRNPLHAKISDVSDTRFKALLSDSSSCEDRRYLFEISRAEALEMVVAQHSGIKEAMSVTGLKFLGLSYEIDLRRDIAVAMEEVVDFVWPTGSVPPPVPHSVRQMHRNDCGLSVVLYNYKELECILAPTPLRWVIYEREENVGFEEVMRAGDEFVVWADGVKNTRDDIMNPTKCRVVADHKMLQEYKMKITKTISRCGHGGHTDVCHGYGKMKEYTCTQLLKLSRNQCDSMTYSNGECYLHNEARSDFWDGDCSNKLGFWARPSESRRRS